MPGPQQMPAFTLQHSLISLFTSERRNPTITTALLSLSFVPLAPTHGHHSQKWICCFLFVSAMTELFIVEADEIVVLILSFFLHLFLSVVCLLLGLPHVSLAFSAVISSSLTVVYIILPLTFQFPFPVVARGLYMLIFQLFLRLNCLLCT